jgi:iron complex outermembrane recepter protein
MLNTTKRQGRTLISTLSLGTCAVALLAGLGITTAAHAQSTAGQIEEIIISGKRGPQYVGGLVTDEQASKSRSNVSQEFIETQGPGQSVAQLINLLPGVSFTNNDPYGNSGGNLRLRGFDGNRVSLTFDGMPLNDTGNYAIFTNQQLDSELVTRVNVNLGTTDIDSPTASAAGGTVNYVTRKPKDDPGAEASFSIGDYSYRRIFAAVDTGKIGEFETSAFIGASYTRYNKFRGNGNLEKKQFNASVYQPFRGQDFVKISGHWNENRNTFYGFVTKADIAANGWSFDPINNSATLASGNFPGYRINPSNTGNVRAQSRYTLSDSLVLTFDPYIQYVLANGGGSSTISERDTRLIGTASVAGVDLNGNCAAAVVNANGVRVIPTGTPTTAAGCNDSTQRFYSPSNTNTWRPGLTSSLLYDINDDHRVRVSYTLDYGRHRQTGEWSFLNADGKPNSVFGGKEDAGNRVPTADGNFIRGRDRYSVAQLNQVSAEYQGEFLDKSLRFNVGARFPFFKRELNQYCNTTLGSTVTCTTGTPSPTTVTSVFRPNGMAIPLGTTGVTATNVGVLAPFSTTRNFNVILPTFGATYRPADEHLFYFNFSQSLSVPRTDNIYARTNFAPTATASTVVPFSDSQLPSLASERADNYDVGYRYQGSVFVGSLGLYYNEFTNFIVSSVSAEDPNTRIDRNIGDVESYGLNAEIGIEPIEDLTTYLTFSYDHRELKNDYAAAADRRVVGGTVVTNLVNNTGNPTATPDQIAAFNSATYYVQNGTVFLRTKGKQIVEVPEITVGGRVQYKWNNFRIGANAKYTGERYSTDVNDEQTEDRTIVDFDLSYDFSDYFGGEGSSIQLNIDNLFDTRYLASINSGATATSFVIAGNPFTPQYSIGAPRTVRASVKLTF